MTDAVQVEYLRRFGVHFRFWRKRCGLSQLQVAGKLGIDPSAVSAWTRGKNFPSMAMVYRLCEEVFGIHVWQFFERPKSAWRLRLVPDTTAAAP